MLNFYYWYSIITSFTILLYIFPFSKFNSSMDPLFLVMIIVSILLSTFLGYVNKEKFIYKKADVNLKKQTYLPLVLIITLSLFEFAYLKDIPLFSVVINQTNNYREVETIPFLHVFISMLSFYYSIKYFYYGISIKQNKKKNILACIIINVIMLLYNMRSFFLINFFICLNIYIAQYRLYKKIRKKTYVIIVLLIPLVLYAFGTYGNLRQGYKWNDSSYIEQLGLYDNWPEFIPKQYMWSYSYITSPLANLNYNIKYEQKEFNVSGIFYQILPQSISKRMPNYNKLSTCKLIKSYFNVSTGFCNSYSNGGYIGLIFFWFIIMVFPLLLFNYKEKEYKVNNYYIWMFIYCGCISFMFFDNMFSYGGTSPALWLSTLILINNVKLRFK